MTFRTLSGVVPTLASGDHAPQVFGPSGLPYRFETLRTRANLLPTPIPVTMSGGWAANNSATATSTQEAAFGRPGGSGVCRKGTAVADTTEVVSLYGVGHNSSATPGSATGKMVVSQGSTYVYGLWVHGGNLGVVANLTTSWSTSDGTFISTRTINKGSVAAGQWAYVLDTMTPPVGAAYASTGYRARKIGGGNFAAGDYAYATDAMFEQAPNLLPLPVPPATMTGSAWVSNNDAIWLGEVDTTTLRPGGGARAVRQVNQTSASLTLFSASGLGHEQIDGPRAYPGAPHTVSAWVYCGTRSGMSRLSVQYYNVSGTQIGSTVTGPLSSTIPTGAWTLASYTFTPPPGTVTTRYGIDVMTSDGLTANTGDWTLVMDARLEGPAPSSFGTPLTGDISDCKGYAPAWTGTANASASTATPILWL